MNKFHAKSRVIPSERQERNRLLVSEVFYSIQGEGRYAGTPSVFIRTSGCNLRCGFCDTPYTSWNLEGEEISLQNLLDNVARWDCEHVVITGGEPLIVQQVVDLTRELKARRHFITIETAGTVDLPVDADLMSISPKLNNSVPQGTDWEQRHNQRRHQPNVIRRLIRDYDYQLKFVIDTAEDLDDVEGWLQEFPEVDSEAIMLMPQATDASTLKEKQPWVAREAASRGWKLSPRLHIEQFGNRRGT